MNCLAGAWRNCYIHSRLATPRIFHLIPIPNISSQILPYLTLCSISHILPAYNI
jgi:hypothetical protein